MVMSIKSSCILFCDDIRREINGKLIIVGGYTSNVVVPEPDESVRLNVLWVVSGLDYGLRDAEFTAYGTDGQECGRKKMKMAVKRPDMPCEFTLEGVPFRVLKDGIIRLTLSIDGAALPDAGELSAAIRPYPSATLPPDHTGAATEENAVGIGARSALHLGKGKKRAPDQKPRAPE